MTVIAHNHTDIPLTSPLRTLPKRGLPPSLFSTPHPHGLLSGHSRSPNAQRAFDARKATIMRTMTAAEIEAAYQEKVKDILKVVEEDRKMNEEVERKVELLRKQREMERRVFWKMREERERGREGGGA
ncbi:hypothetical protein MMC08_004300 [Hypocenomyce scalaris]|nr:hypothetical protein [Hypocenomyce scalaris]